MRPFIIDDTIRAKITKLVAYAEDHPVTMDDLLDQMNGDKQPIGYKKEHSLILPFGYRIVYSIEQQPIGDCRHLSMSVDADGKMPNPVAVKEIMNLIGFNNRLEKCRVWTEEIGKNRDAINVVEIKPKGNK